MKPAFVYRLRRAKPARRVLAASIGGLLGLALLVVPFLMTVEPPEPEGGWHINVRWAPDVSSDAQRAELEARYHLHVLQQHDGRTWVYRLRDTSRANIRALVTDPRAEDTNGIDRSDYRVTAPRVSLARDWADRHPDAAERLQEAISWRSVPPILLVLIACLALGQPRVRARLERGIPPLSAAGLGLYRAALGLAVAAVVIKYNDLPGTPFPRDLHRAYDWFANWEWVHRLAERPDLDQWTTPVCVVLMLMFAAGFFARASYVLFLCVLTAHVLVVLQHKSAHDWGLPLVTLWGLAFVPWDEGIGVRRRPSAANANYGFAVWFPGLMLGLAFLAAAYAKLDSSGFAWVTGGAVKYHFLEDWKQAPTDWGLHVASRPGLAVALSASAILVESLFILHIFWRNAWVRALFAAPALGLLAGFRLLQGVVWTQWWVLFLAFVPWQTIAVRTVARDAANAGVTHQPALRGAAPALVATLVAVQLVASSWRIEMEPFISDFGMYSWTWASPAAFDAQLARKYRRYSYRAWRANAAAEDLTPRLAAIAKASDLLADVTDDARAGAVLGDERQRALAALSAAYADAYGEPLGPLLVLVDEEAFDWQRGMFVRTSDDRPVGVLDVTAGTMTAVADETVSARSGR
jgi:hypothetical protein